MYSSASRRFLAHPGSVEPQEIHGNQVGSGSLNGQGKNNLLEELHDVIDFLKLVERTLEVMNNSVSSVKNTFKLF